MNQRLYQRKKEWRKNIHISVPLSQFCRHGKKHTIFDSWLMHSQHHLHPTPIGYKMSHIGSCNSETETCFSLSSYNDNNRKGITLPLWYDRLATLDHPSFRLRLHSEDVWCLKGRFGVGQKWVEVNPMLIETAPLNLHPPIFQFMWMRSYIKKGGEGIWCRWGLNEINVDKTWADVCIFLYNTRTYTVYKPQ